MTGAQIHDKAAISEDGFDRIEAIRCILLRKRLVFLIIVASGISGAALGMWIKPSYTAKATFLPPATPSSGSSMLMGQLGALSGAGSALGGLKDPSMIYIGILGSRTVADDLIHQFHLETVYKTKKLSSTEKALADHTKFLPGKDTLVTISVEDHDANRAADMANAYLKSLSRQNDRLALTDAAQRRAFFERQLEKEKNLLADAEVELARTEEQTGIIHPNGQAQIQIETIAQTQASISNREVELAALSQGATDQNPDVIRLRSEITGLKAQLSAQENSGAKGNPGDILVPTSKVPALSLVYVRRERDVRYHEALYALLLRQFESAKLDESRSAPLMQIVDEAVVPDTKSGPARTLLTLAFVILGGFVGSIWAIFPAFWEKKMRNPAFSTTWRSLREAARFGGPRL